ncbi:MAG: iron ABC transporter permease [Pseudomonadota bacterium]
MIRPQPLLLGLLLLSGVSLAAALLIGSVAVSPGTVWTVLWGGGDALQRAVLLELRLPRALSAFAVGGLLALAGALMQVLLRNPLADPYILGVSGGAAVFTLTAMLLGASGALLSGAAFGGALFTMLLVFALARRQGSWTPVRLLLTGVVIASGWAALIGFILAVSPDTTLRGMLFWLMGDLEFAARPYSAWAVLAAGLAVALVLARDLNVLARGDLQARALGVPVGVLFPLLYVGASLLTAAAVTLAGTVGFIGLIVPHLLRLVAGGDHRVLLPGAVLLGGSLLTAADTLARTVIAPQQLPVGVITALLGVPVFLYLLNRRGG